MKISQFRVVRRSHKLTVRQKIIAENEANKKTLELRPARSAKVKAAAKRMLVSADEYFDDHNDEDEGSSKKHKSKRKLETSNSKKQKCVPKAYVEEEYPKTTIRNSPKRLIEVIALLSKEQRIWVEQAGFGALLDFKLEYIPHRIGCYVLQSYNIQTNTIKLENGMSVAVTEDEVERIFHLPRGDEEIVPVGKVVQQQRIAAWRDQFRGQVINLWRISACDVIQMMKGSSSEVTESFKHNFILVLTTVLIAPQTNNNICQSLLESNLDFNKCTEYNWCSFVIKNLREARVSWNGPKSIFCGPLIFLILLYVDRVMQEGATAVPRTIPAYKAWTTLRLRKREKFEVKERLIGRGIVKEDDYEGEEENDIFDSNSLANEPNNYVQVEEFDIVDDLEKYANHLTCAVAKYDVLLAYFRSLNVHNQRVETINKNIVAFFRGREGCECPNIPSSQSSTSQKTPTPRSQDSPTYSDFERLSQEYHDFILKKSKVLPTHQPSEQQSP